ncbi:MAG: PA2778 family cysteine peptidase [Betaproteobacteria bacterium]|nr:PA2778 family cysteine peptidase [Betaproteobacteria bacterium]
MNPGSKTRRLAGFLLAAALAGCALFPQSFALRDRPPADLPPRAELVATPFFPQEDYYCGPAALAMALNAAGRGVAPESLVDQVYVPARKGSFQVEMLAAARRNGLVAVELAPRIEDVLRELAAGTPVIVLQNLGFSWFPTWHYAVAVGYDLKEGEIVLRSGTRERTRIPFPAFEFTWEDGRHWAMVVMAPERLPATVDEARYAAAVVALERIGRVVEARAAYRSMFSRWPRSLAAAMGLGNTHYALGEIAPAEAAFRKAAADHPDSAAAFNNLAIILAEQGRYEEALQTVERAIGLGGPFAATARATRDEIARKAASRR